MSEIIMPGVVICPGIGIGQVVLVDTEVVIPRHKISADHIADEHERYMKAVDELRRHVREHAKATRHDTPEQNAAIVAVQSAMLQDMDFHESICERIASGLKNAEWALEFEARNLIEKFEAMRDQFNRARAEDVRDMARGILDVLENGGHHSELAKTDTPQVFASTYLHPSTAMLAQRHSAAAFVTESRALSAHAAFLLKGFGIPALGCVQGLIGSVIAGNEIIVDAVKGQVIIRPTKDTLDSYVQRRKEFRTSLGVIPPIPCHTADGTEVRLHGNIGNPDQVSLILHKGLQGVGLFRTEFFAMEDGRVPGEEEQAEIYQRVFLALDGRPLVVRTFDIGADKQVHALDAPVGQNPALGVRGIRRQLLGNRAELEAQYRAILRAAADGEVSIMIPMVTTLKDIRQAKQHLDKALAALVASNTPHAQKVRFGAMIETPAAALIVADILGEVDFVSLGTNDLLQYLTAADRDNENVIDYLDSGHPAFQLLLKHIINEAMRLGRQDDVSICGEIASRRQEIPILLRMGYRSFSISPVMVDDIRDTIAATDLGQPE